MYNAYIKFFEEKFRGGRENAKLMQQYIRIINFDVAINFYKRNLEFLNY